MEFSQGEKARLLAESADLQDLTAAQRAELAARAQPRHCPRGSLVWATGDTVDGVFLLVSGIVHVQMLGANGDLILTGLVSPGAVIGEAEVFTGEPRRFNQVVAAGDCQLLWVPLNPFLQLLEDNAAFARHWLRMANRKFIGTLHQVNSLKIGSPAARLARMLLLLYRWHGKNLDDLALSQETLGRYVGLSRQVINGILVEWQRAGWVSKGYGRLKLEDPRALGRVAQDRP